MDAESLEPDIVRKGVHEIDSDIDMAITGHDLNGRRVEFSEFRPTNDESTVLSRVMYHGESGEIVSEHAIIKRRIVAAGETGVDFVKHHKGKIAVVGSAVIMVAASTGFLVRRFRSGGK